MGLYDALLSLLDYLDTTAPQITMIWREWWITPIAGGANNLLYQVANLHGIYAVKYTVCDERNRAQREYDALTVLRQAGLSLAPYAVWVNHDRYRQPVIVQTWIDGVIVTGAPTTDTDWEALLQHYCAIHTVTPVHTTLTIADAVLNVADGAAGQALIMRHAAKLPSRARPASFHSILAQIEAWNPPSWPAAPRVLCRNDPSPRNFIQRGTDWVSVDWENSGWGDPAFELADLMTHPAYVAVPTSRWEWLINAYAERRNDPGAVTRIHTYYTLMLVWWVVRLARYLYETPRGLDPRLASPPAWHAEMEDQYHQFAARATAHMETLF